MIKINNPKYNKVTIQELRQVIVNAIFNCRQICEIFINVIVKILYRKIKVYVLNAGCSYSHHLCHNFNSAIFSEITVFHFCLRSIRRHSVINMVHFVIIFFSIFKQMPRFFDFFLSVSGMVTNFLCVLRYSRSHWSIWCLSLFTSSLVR